MLTVYDPTTGNHKNYVPATDRCLRESVDPDSPRLPPFHHETEDRIRDSHLNVFLVALNAEIKFRQYFEMIDSHPPKTPLPDWVLTLMHRTVELVELIYWEPVAIKGSPGEKILLERAARRAKTKRVERGGGEDIEVAMEEDEDTQDPAPVRAASSSSSEFSWPAHMDLEARIAYGRSIMCGHGATLFPLSS